VDVRGDSATSLDDGRILFEGDACLEFVGGRLPAKIMAERIVVNLHDGSYEVNPAALGRRLVRQAGHVILRQVGHAEESAAPVKKPLWLKGWGVSKPAAPAKPGWVKKWFGDGTEGCAGCPRR
jgi:hypothetical protein